jgi:hypothetical protein
MVMKRSDSVMQSIADAQIPNDLSKDQLIHEKFIVIELWLWRFMAGCKL